MPAPENGPKLKQCPMCGKDMPVMGECPNEECGFDDGEAERTARSKVYINKRVREIESESVEAEKIAQKKKKRGLFSSRIED